MHAGGMPGWENAGPVNITFLGTGTSHGIPMIACDCRICTSTDPRDKRTRPSILVEYGSRSVLIDTTPEFRLQCIANNVRSVNAVLFTHVHADHVTGLDDLRRFNDILRAPLPVYGNKATLDHLQQMFGYAFTHNPYYVSAKPTLQPIPIDGPFELFGRQVTPIHLPHGPTCVLGYRIGRLAYCTDCSDIPPAAQDLLKDLDVLVLDALRIRPHPTHLNLEQAIDWARRIGAKRTLFTHIAHEILHAEIQPTLPAGMELAYDGMKVEMGE
jgi:phosphoribosyl 1,2-cyclic phosphate phosphodiesterase